MKKYTKKVICLLLGLFFITSCGQTNTQNGQDGGGGGGSDPQLVLKKLTIFGEDVFEKGVDDEKNMSYFSNKREIRSYDIRAEFDYGEEKDERIGIRVEGGYFTADETKATSMKMKVPAVKGSYQEWTGSVMITLKEQDMEVLIAFDGQPQPNGTEKELSLEVVEFIVQCREDIVEKVIINDEKENHELKLEETQNMQGGTIYGAFLKLLLNTERYTNYKVTVKPKNPKLYLETEATYSIKGTKIPDDNAKFIYTQDGETSLPNIDYDPTWEPDCESNYPEDYGVKSLKITAYTESPRASVFLKRVNPLDDSTIGSEVELTSDGKGMHQTNIELFDDKTTKLVLYVKSKNNTLDNEKGKCEKEFNPLDLFWGYDDTKLSTEELRKGAGRGYSEITVEKSKIAGNKVYIAFSIWDEAIGFTPSDSVKAMSDFKKLDTTGDEDNLVTTYQFTVDVSSLNVGDSKDIEIPIMRIPAGEESTPQIKAFTYKFKLKVM